ncbi:metallophosphoesterase [Neorhizobium galegae]|uniref:metallophosphoesterase family protein n=1 Tax=Neorhizobium galegae TaxID=399 RepID=UPI00062214F6|nr:metallophosphoesterase family protein [Neorhizobium galegae]CDZ30796.1 Calcineurin-like phosphoesterase family protein [Neorhizobium galegae bv. officinalis]KAA9387966.1 metallophosphoesterase family protein [Neorhizobium galegae]KAB1115572.1 metallophosphoesterase family protein [Neorhizobium galegae]MCM2499619.1 metallophosphatase family protein [Neorhizobium galegae]MCQ1773477.1 metallophosphatase family protein [Neorhizobium galegae]
MRFAAIADIHGNCAALEAVLADIHAQDITDIVNLGDCLSGPLEAGRTADLLLLLDTMATLTVRGNHDRYLIENPADAMPSWEVHAFSELAPRHLQWLRKLPFSAVYRSEAYLCHATPQSDNVYWLEQVSSEGHVFLKPLEEIEALAEGIEQPLILCGHSHIPRAVQLSDGRLIVNPGSVGCPAYDDDTPCFHKVETGHTMASYAILEKTSAGWIPQFRNVAYDHLAMSRLAAENGRADWAVALATGRAG